MYKRILFLVLCSVSFVQAGSIYQQDQKQQSWYLAFTIYYPEIEKESFYYPDLDEKGKPNVYSKDECFDNAHGKKRNDAKQKHPKALAVGAVCIPESLAKKVLKMKPMLPH